ncbi:MAG: restriction endonuclease subunit S, partial [Clostridia bacterium]|nr:restriction endonuclease subunit S [Clostridia bacterium]
MAKYRFDEIAINSTAKKKPVEEDKYTYLGLENLDSCCLQVTRFGSDVAPIGEKLIMKKGDVLFGKRRAYQKKVAIAPFDGIFSAHGMVLRPKEKVVTKEFFPFFISSDYFLDAAIKISVGSLSPTINWSSLKELEFNLPDICEQKKLVGILCAANETKEAYKSLLSITDELVKSQFIEMFG